MCVWSGWEGGWVHLLSVTHAIGSGRLGREAEWLVSGLTQGLGVQGAGLTLKNALAKKKVTGRLKNFCEFQGLQCLNFEHVCQTTTSGLHHKSPITLALATVACLLWCSLGVDWARVGEGGNRCSVLCSGQ